MKNKIGFNVPNTFKFPNNFSDSLCYICILVKDNSFCVHDAIT